MKNTKRFLGLLWQTLPVRRAIEPQRLVVLTILTTVICLASCTKSVPVTPPAPPPVNKDWLITASFTYNFTNYMRCSASVTSGCITGFTWGYTNAQGAQVPLKTSAVSVCSGTAQPQACTDTSNSQLPIGSNIFTIVVNYIDAAGKPQVTAPRDSRVTHSNCCRAPVRFHHHRPVASAAADCARCNTSAMPP